MYQAQAEFQCVSHSEICSADKMIYFVRSCHLTIALFQGQEMATCISLNTFLDATYMIPCGRVSKKEMGISVSLVISSLTAFSLTKFKLFSFVALNQNCLYTNLLDCLFILVSAMASFFLPDFNNLPISSGFFTKYSDRFST